MAQFGFFNEGFAKDPGIEFTKEENNFFEGKLMFLDPKKTGKIELAVALHFIRCSNLRAPEVQKIMKNCKKDNQNTLTYEEMKKVFRGVGLAQHKIQPSVVNIQANIPNKMPKFYDDDEDEDDEEEDKPVSQPPKQPPTQQVPVRQPPAKTVTPPQKVQPQPPPQSQPKPHHQDPNSKIKQFEVYWSKLATKNNKIQGGQVKTICKNLAQRANLSKAWKLCCKAHSGSLTKGEFFVFKELITSADLPESLSPEMKAAIAYFDEQTPPHQKKKDQPPPPNTSSQLKASQLFQNFGKSQLSVPAPSSPVTPSQTSLNFEAMNAERQKFVEKLQCAKGGIAAEQKINEQQLVNFRRGQQSMNNMLGQVEQFLQMVSGKNNEIRGQIDELKNNQGVLNERLNRVMMGMNSVIVRQNTYIDELLKEMVQRSSMDQQRIAVLEQYVADAMQYQQQREQTNPIQPNNLTTNQPTITRQPKPSPKIKQTPTIQKKQTEQQFPDIQNQKLQYKHPETYREAEPEEQHPEQEYRKQQQKGRQASPSPQAMQHQQNMQSQRPPPQTPPRTTQSNLSSVQTSPQITVEQRQTQQRIKLKQMRLLQLIHELNPISPQVYPQILTKVCSQSQQNLDRAYSRLWGQLQEHRLQQEAAYAASSGKVSSTMSNAKPNVVAESDDFSSSNFAGGNPSGEDLFK